ncbi:MAG: pyridoxal phosphate synthase yaaE subunit [Clostridia bacterium]|jgi:5'-phosphate synthase pdxT subunit|uniref:pyridoxal 5'-phosphate synthase glutaminase subunit PdxT n=1 Tax=Petroclostridium xylanilyticum TaxID=1792311 RepID=UPI000B98C47B|nr:pyridoxal 5'-phosphate synthase glutaminase subunit PdxT [Petroclostridium xylanilyticum]MBZ4645123.1 pyridoxal phosphate synthase yaaE subunit [Clostridia bacterium]
MIKIGVLGLQGAVAEHITMLHQFDNVQPVVVKTKPELDSVEALIMPGGESTAIGKLLDDFNLMDVLAERIRKGMPVWGTCAGMILLAKKISNHDRTFLNAMDIQVRRNAYGSQLDSFRTTLNIPEISEAEIPLVFIRAPYVEEAWNDVKVLAKVDDKIVACKQNNMLATSFHPELTNDLSFHKYFIEKMVKPGNINAD